MAGLSVHAAAPPPPVEPPRSNERTPQQSLINAVLLFVAVVGVSSAIGWGVARIVGSVDDERGCETELRTVSTAQAVAAGTYGRYLSLDELVSVGLLADETWRVRVTLSGPPDQAIAYSATGTGVCEGFGGVR